MPALTHRAGAPLRAVASFGGAVALLLAIALAWVLANDRDNRIAAAQGKALLLTTSTERLLDFQFRNLERALLGIADDGAELFRRVPAQAPDMLNASMSGVVARNAEIDSIVVLDGTGRALTAGRGDPALPRWAVPGAHGPGRKLYLGPLERRGDGWLLRLAVRMGEGRWLLARLRTDELQHLLSNMDLGADGVVSVIGGDGTIIVRNPDALRLTGRQVPPALPGPEFPDHAVALGSHASRFDGTLRIAAATELRNYPLQVFAALDRREVLAPWWMFLGTTAVLYLMYCIGLVYLLRSMHRAERRQDRLQAELRAGDEELRLAYQVGGVGTWWIGPDGQWLHWSPQTMKMLDVERSRMQVRDFLALVHEDDRARVRQSLQAAWRGGEVFDISGRVRLPTLGERWLAARGALVEGGGGRRMTGTLLDMSERVEIQTMALDAQRQFRLIFELNPLPCWLFDLDSLRFIEVNPAAVCQYGYSRDEFLKLSVTDILLPEDAAGAVRRARAPDPLGRNSARVTLHRRKDGSLIDVRVHASTLQVAGIEARLVLAENISELMAHQRELAHRASHDALTGLLTVGALAERLAALADDARYTVAHLQLRGLQLIGDTLGREVGEEVLLQLCRELQARVDGHGWIAFQPAEDFVVALDDRHDADALVEMLAMLLSGPVRGRDSMHQLDVHIGVARFRADAADAEDAIGKAAQAAHAARERGVLVTRFDCAIAARLSERLRMVGRLHEAIDRGEFELHYQPIQHARDRRPAALEALLRWRRPDGGMVQPDEFIQLCEDTGLIVPLGRWVIGQAARDQRRLADAGWPDLAIAINVSALQFLNTDLAADVGAASSEHGLGRGALHVELTESSLMRDPELALRTMHELHAQGVCISLDDFGTGFSSMSYLQNMPLDSLKIDRSFVTDVDTNARNASICRALLTLGHNLGLKVIAEGVETPAQYDWLSDNGCDQVQGFLLGRPGPFEQVVGQLRRGADH